MLLSLVKKDGKLIFTNKFYLIISVGIFTRLKLGAEEVYNSPKLLLGVLTNTQARMNSIILTFFINMWVKTYMSDNDEAYSRAMMLSGIANVVGMISAVLFGFIFENARSTTLLLINNLLVVIGYSMLLFIDEKNNLIILAFSLASFGFYGLVTLGYVILNKNVGHSARGAVMGINTWGGAVGILVLTKLGGYLFTNVSVLSPFMMCAVLSLIVSVVLMIPYFKRKFEESN
jgi:predicted MFS family arabinose efflux permease